MVTQLEAWERQDRYAEVQRRLLLADLHAPDVLEDFMRLNPVDPEA